MSDLIDRQEAIDALEEPLKVSDTWTDEYAVGERMQWEKDVKALKSLPSAQPERKTGKWVKFPQPLDEVYMCTNCKAGTWQRWAKGMMGRMTLYCPWCGAEMEPENERK